MQDPHEGSWIQKSMLRVSTIYFPLPEKYSIPLYVNHTRKLQITRHSSMGDKLQKQIVNTYSQYNCEHILHIYELRQIKGEGSEAKWSC